MPRDTSWWLARWDKPPRRCCNLTLHLPSSPPVPLVVGAPLPTAMVSFLQMELQPTGQLHAAMDSFAMIDLLVRNLDLPVIWIPGPRQVKPTEQQLYCTCPCKSNCVGECVSLITTTATLHVLFRRSTILQFFFSCLTAAPSSFLGLADESFSDVQSIPVLCSLEPWTLDYSSVNSAVWDLFNYCQHCT
jgi:hypothetical protein